MDNLGLLIGGCVMLIISVISLKSGYWKNNEAGQPLILIEIIIIVVSLFAILLGIVNILTT